MENSVEEDIAKVNTYIELVLEKDYCNCNELNTILGKHCDGSKNVAYAMQHILSDYKRVLKENEEKTTILLTGAEKVKQLEKENEELKKFITEGITIAPHSTYKNYRLDFLRENFVSKKKIKDKIEELEKEIEEKQEHGLDFTLIHEHEIDTDAIIQVLNELLDDKN